MKKLLVKKPKAVPEEEEEAEDEPVKVPLKRKPKKKQERELEIVGDIQSGETEIIEQITVRRRTSRSEKAPTPHRKHDETEDPTTFHSF